MARYCLSHLHLYSGSIDCFGKKLPTYGVGRHICQSCVTKFSSILYVKVIQLIFMICFLFPLTHVVLVCILQIYDFNHTCGKGRKMDIAVITNTFVVNVTYISVRENSRTSIIWSRYSDEAFFCTMFVCFKGALSYAFEVWQAFFSLFVMFFPRDLSYVYGEAIIYSWTFIGMVFQKKKYKSLSIIFEHYCNKQ